MPPEAPDKIKAGRKKDVNNNTTFDLNSPKFAENS